MRCVLILFCTLALPLSLIASETPAAPILVHEWGTFTSMQNEDGVSVGGVNNEEEALPDFVHTLGWQIQLQNRLGSDNVKGTVRSRADVTMRLETPVLYFHLPAGVTSTRVDVNVKFNGGYLTQYFPLAATVPSTAESLNATITYKTQGALLWKELLVGSTAQPPATGSAIWNAPRRVDAAVVQSTPALFARDEWDSFSQRMLPRQMPQVEKYLFYRGVGRLDAPLSIRRTDSTFRISPSASAAKNLNGIYAPLPKVAWLVDIAENGAVAWREQALKEPALIKNASEAPIESPMADMPGTFTASDYADAHRDTLKVALQSALVTAGLFADEADALLNTWDASYFKSPGLRVFFLVPQDWTDRVLPLTVASTLPVQTQRVMVARVELITPEQRALAGKLVAYSHKPYSAEFQKLYLQLGRFRNVILMDVAEKLHSVINHY